MEARFGMSRQTNDTPELIARSNASSRVTNVGSPRRARVIAVKSDASKSAAASHSFHFPSLSMLDDRGDLCIGHVALRFPRRGDSP